MDALVFKAYFQKLMASFFWRGPNPPHVARSSHMLLDVETGAFWLTAWLQATDHSKDLEDSPTRLSTRRELALPCPEPNIRCEVGPSTPRSRADLPCRLDD